MQLLGLQMQHGAVKVRVAGRWIIKTQRLLSLWLGLLCLVTSPVQAEQLRVLIQTSLGDLVVELDETRSPASVANFLAYVDDGSYTGTIFHRVIPEYVIQAGGHRVDMSEIEDHPPILNEAENGLKNVAGTLAFARSNAIDSATGQFFINLQDNVNLDHTVDSCTRADEQAQEKALARGLHKPIRCKTFGYAVFGRVVEGMHVVNAIASVETRDHPDYADVPVTPIVIESISRIH